MKRISVLFLVMVSIAAFSMAGGINERTFTVTVPLTTVVTASSYVVRGEILGVHVDVTASTCGVAIATDDNQTIFSKAGISSDTYYSIIGNPCVNYLGNIIEPGTGTNLVYRPFVSDGPLTVTVTNSTIAAACTNTYSIKVVFRE